MKSVGSVFMTRLVAFRGQERKQGVNGKQEVLAITNEQMRAAIEEGDYVICRVEERTASLRDENGDVLLNADGTPQLGAEKFIRNEVVMHGDYATIAAAFYADDIMEAQAADFIKEQVVAAKATRVRPVKPEVVVNNPEPVMA